MYPPPAPATGEAAMTEIVISKPGVLVIALTGEWTVTRALPAAPPGQTAHCRRYEFSRTATARTHRRGAVDFGAGVNLESLCTFLGRLTGAIVDSQHLRSLAQVRTGQHLRGRRRPSTAYCI
jgi:hypothetical protein